MNNFRTYEISKELYHLVEAIEGPAHLQDQALRVTTSHDNHRLFAQRQHPPAN
jgi:hypothetical protein